MSFFIIIIIIVIIMMMIIISMIIIKTGVWSPYYSTHSFSACNSSDHCCRAVDTYLPYMSVKYRYFPHFALNFFYYCGVLFCCSQTVVTATYSCEALRKSHNTNLLFSVIVAIANSTGFLLVEGLSWSISPAHDSLLQMFINNHALHFYSAFLDTQSTLH